MGKKRIVKKGGEGEAAGRGSSARATRRKMESGILYVEATYNNTKMCLADTTGNVVAWSSSGSLGFSGAKKGTPFAAAKVGELLGEKATDMGVKEVSVVVCRRGCRPRVVYPRVFAPKASISTPLKTARRCRTTARAA